jgi:flagellar motor switch protein FliN
VKDEGSTTISVGRLTFSVYTCQPRRPALSPADETPDRRDSPSGFHPIERLNEVEMSLSVELGRTRMTMGELVALRVGEIVELKRDESVPVDILVNDSLLARGEIVVQDNKLAVRVTDIAGKDR